MRVPNRWRWCAVCSAPGQVACAQRQARLEPADRHPYRLWVRGVGAVHPRTGEVEA